CRFRGLRLRAELSSSPRLLHRSKLRLRPAEHFTDLVPPLTSTAIDPPPEPTMRMYGSTPTIHDTSMLFRQRWKSTAQPRRSWEIFTETFIRMAEPSPKTRPALPA